MKDRRVREEDQAIERCVQRIRYAITLVPAGVSRGLLLERLLALAEEWSTEADALLEEGT